MATRGPSLAGGRYRKPDVKQIRQRIQQAHDKLNKKHGHEVADKRWTWLSDLTASEAFVVCIGAGPWKFDRREKIQAEALDVLRGRDLSQCSPRRFTYPLDWQMQKVDAMFNHLMCEWCSMEAFVKSLRREPEYAVDDMYRATETKGRAKVLDMFLRDYVKVPAFPVDRWVARELAWWGIPDHEAMIVETCQELEINPRLLARMLLVSSGFSKNPKHRSRAKSCK